MNTIVLKLLYFFSQIPQASTNFTAVDFYGFSAETLEQRTLGTWI